MSLKNLKDGKSTEVAGVRVTRSSGCYIAELADGKWAFAYSKANKWWVVSPAVGEPLTLAIGLDEVVPALLAMVAEAAQEQAQEPAVGAELALPEAATEGQVELAEEVHEAELLPVEEPVEEPPADLEGDVEDEEDDEAAAEGPVTVAYDVNTKGGHAPHRATALATLAVALGAQVGVERPGTWNETVTLLVTAESQKLAEVVAIMQEFEATVEPLAAIVGRSISGLTRTMGGHHSGAGCHARRGFIRGFADAMAETVAGHPVEVPSLGHSQVYDTSAYRTGVAEFQRLSAQEEPAVAPEGPAEPVADEAASKELVLA